MTPEASALAALLAAGHSTADFAFQTRWMVDRKTRPSGALAHAAVVALCALAALVPFFGRAVLLAVLAITASHVLLDAAKAALTRRSPAREWIWFLLDQSAHAAVLILAWLWLLPRAGLAGACLVDPEVLRNAGVLAALVAFNMNGMSAIVRFVIRPLDMAPLEERGPSVGRVIGFLERAFALTLILNDQWSALGLLVAAKSLARFKDLEERKRAEYYLVGTLVSLLGATLSALAAKALLAS